jgi:membrane fusion protein, multidrug efflux system
MLIDPAEKLNISSDIMTTNALLEQKRAHSGIVFFRTSKTTRRMTARMFLTGMAGFILFFLIACYLYYYITIGYFLETTDDAYLRSDSVVISSRISGYLVEVKVSDNEKVKSGTVLARVDDRDLIAALEQAKARVQLARANIDNIDKKISLQKFHVEAQEADVEAGVAAMKFSQEEHQRYQNLMGTGTGSVQRAQQALADAGQKEAALKRNRALLEAAKNEIQVLNSEREIATATHRVESANLLQAELNHSYSTITAPVDGVVGDRSLRVGQYVQPGRALMQIVPMHQNLYVVANFKETQIERLSLGQPAMISVDSLTEGCFNGDVESMSPGTGSVFALLPPENATGNFTKIVQRVPVKILLLSTSLRLDQLRPGLSVIATIDTRSSAKDKNAKPRPCNL